MEFGDSEEEKEPRLLNRGPDIVGGSDWAEDESKHVPQGFENPDSLSSLSIISTRISIEDKDEGVYIASDQKSGLRADGESRGRALSALAAKIISNEEENSSLLELAGSLTSEEAAEAKSSIEATKQQDISNAQDIPSDLSGSNSQDDS